MSRKKQQTLFEKLSFDETMRMYVCQYPLAGRSIEVFVTFEDDATNSLERLADSIEAFLRQWESLQKAMFEPVRQELAASGRLHPANESKLTLAAIAPRSLHVIHAPPDETTLNFGIHLPDFLDEMEFFEYRCNFTRTFEATEIDFMA